MNTVNSSKSEPSIPFVHKKVNTFEEDFKNFEELAESDNWKEAIAKGSQLIEIAHKTERFKEEAKICAQLTATSFYLGDYNQALSYVKRCRELSKEFRDQSIFLRALYLESAAHRALAAKANEGKMQQSYLYAVKIGEEAASLYSKSVVKNSTLCGKIYFNLGAAHADNPKGDLKKAAACYTIANECFKQSKSTNDVVRTSLRLGKVHLLQSKPALAQKMLDQLRPSISSERLLMHADYLEAQVKFAEKENEKGLEIARNGLKRAHFLGAKEDQLRFNSLLQ